MRTGVITFNVRDRGRKYRGQDRNYDTVALAELINSGPIQERVRKRDLHGYFGHWPRVRFGLHPGEGGVVNGKQVTLEPATVTVSLSASPDGIITHEAEFLDTAPGRTAKRMWNSKTGGFSSAMDCVPGANGMPDMPRDFAGFDYVLEPNFSGNRGWALDSAMAGEAENFGEFMDSVAAETAATVRALDGQLNSLQASYDALLMRSAQQANEINELVEMLSRIPGAKSDAAQRLATMDSVPVAAGRTVRFDSARLAKQAKEFAGMQLASFDNVAAVDEQKEAERERRRIDAIVEQQLGFLA